ncbi:MAG: TonB-dependent receptor [Spirochaetaceae bacterium]|nr:TonB-dependent receptor [Myxococcales bacterium]MCB9725970.1 TonB-dependent receptor [Spirochaetaceae bacterium]HPG24313.1 TonB-dependent receptor [Myxococcota bacterium]
MSLGRGPRRSRRVHRLRVVAFVIALLGVTSGTAWAQGGTGTISGRVFDAESGAPIEGATVILAYPEQADGSDAPQQVVVTGIEGDYEFGAVPAGFYGLSFIKSGYRASNVTNVQVVSGKDAVTNFPLPPAQALAGGDVMELEAYTVEASVVGDLMNDLELRLESDQMLNLLSAEDLSKFAASDVADALKRVAGVNVVAGRFAIIRGLEERYSATLYNGAPVPSPDPDRQSVQLDLFPSDIVSSLQLAKTFESTSPSNAAAGSIDIVTHDYPDELTFKWTAGTGFNEPALDNFLRHQDNSPIGIIVDGDHALESDISGFVGGTFDVFDRELQFKLVVAQEIDFETFEGMQQSRQPELPVTRRGFVIGSGDLSKGVLSLSGGRFDLTQSARIEQDTYFGAFGLDLDREGDHRIDASAFYTKKQQETVLLLENGFFPNVDYAALTPEDYLRPQTFEDFATRQSFLGSFREEESAVNRGPLSFLPRYQSASFDESRELQIYQLNAQHDLGELFEGLELSWIANYSETKQSERIFQSRYWYEPNVVPEPIPGSFIPTGFPPKVSDFGPGQFTGGTAGTTIYFDNQIEENQYFFRADLGYAFSPWRPLEVALGTGFWFEQANRSVDVLTSVTPVPLAGRGGVVGTGSTAYVQAPDAAQLGRRLFSALGLDDLENPGRSRFKREVIAWSGDAKLTFAEDLDWLWNYHLDFDVFGGVRIENLRITSINDPRNGFCSDASREANGPNGRCPPGTIPQIFPGTYLFIDRFDNPDNPILAEPTPPPGFVYNDQILGINLPTDENGIVDVLSLQDIFRVVNGEIDELQILPDLGITWRVADNVMLRGAWSQTVARPSFRELGYYVTIKPGISDFIVGNPQLGLSKVESFDVRAEFTWGELGDLAAISFFDKTIDNPIEAIVLRNPTDLVYSYRTWRNNPNQATLRGVELEARQNLGILHDVLEVISIGGNFTYIDAEVERTPLEIARAAAFYGATQADIDAGLIHFSRLKRKRRLFNQPEWIANGDITFDHPDWGTKATLSIFAISEVLDTAGSGNLLPNGNLDSINLDRFTDEYFQVDFVISQTFGIPRIPGEWTVKTSIKNLTDSSRGVIYDQSQTVDDVHERSFKQGRDYTFGLGYTLVY